jgi:adenylate kinase family enzyme
MNNCKQLRTKNRRVKMQRIWITGSSGSGKTTLANIIGTKLNIPVYYNDRIFWMEGWHERPTIEQIEITKGISDKDRWIYEGNRFSDCKKDGRYNQCDTIIFLKINRFICLYRFLKRFLEHRGTVRPDITEGCTEKIDIDIVKYIIFDYPKKNNERQKLFTEAAKDKKNVIILNGVKSVKKWLDTL